MGQVRVTGPDVEKALERALPLDFDDWPVGLQRYSLLLNERGGIEDDLMVTRLADEVRIVVNASTKDKDLQLLRERCPRLSFDLLDAALIALQGPHAPLALPAAAGLKFMQAGTFPLARSECLVSRSGYTGEDGYEISVPRESAERLARELLANPAVKAVGLGARDTLRLEAGLHLYGQDMNADTTVLEASLGWAIAKSRRAGAKKEGGFPGAEVYLRQGREGVKKKLQGLIGEENVPIRHDSPLVGEDKDVGVVTSGTVSPTLQKPIMLGYVRSGAPENLFAVVRGAKRPVKLAKLPFVPKRFKK
jgi:aminomethyltransferase